MNNMIIKTSITILLALLLVSCTSTRRLASADSKTIVRVAKAAKSSGNYQTAANIFKRAHSISPKDDDITLELAQTLVQAKQYSEAELYFESLQKSKKYATDASIGLAQVNFALTKRGIAVKHFDEALKSNRLNVKALSGIGVVLDTLELHQEARRCYFKALSKDNSNLALYNNIGLSFALSGNLDKAESFLKKSAHLDNANSTSVVNAKIIQSYKSEIAKSPQKRHIYMKQLKTVLMGKKYQNKQKLKKYAKSSYQKYCI